MPATGCSKIIFEQNNVVDLATVRIGRRKCAGAVRSHIAWDAERKNEAPSTQKPAYYILPILRIDGDSMVGG